jgi:CRP-like cAMP-binding protein
MSDISATLAQLPLLKGLGDETLAAIAQAGIPLRLAAGDVLFRQGDDGETLYILVSGELHVRVGGAPGEPRSMTLAPITPGEVVGELALLAGAPRSADVVAVADSALLMFDRIHALGLLGAHPILARRVMSQIATRLAHVALTSGPQQGPAHTGVSVRRLKAGAESALDQALASLPVAAHESLAEAGVRSIDTFQCGRTIVTVWTTDGKTDGFPEPSFASTSTPSNSALRSFFEDQDADQGTCTLIHHWQATESAKV